MSNKYESRHKWLMFSLLFMSVVVGAGWFAVGYLGDMARQEIVKENEATITLLSTHLTDELKKLAGAARAMSGSPWISPALISGKDQDIARANSVLDRYNSAMGASVSYLMDSAGKTIASSNRNDPDSFVGKSYQFRPYFTQAISGNAGRYFALGVTSLKRGFYTSYPIRNGKGAIIGVATMKKDLDDIEANLSGYSDFFFINPQGIIFLSNKKEMLVKSLWPISKETERALLASKQFGEKPFKAVMPQEITDRTDITLNGKRYLVSRKVIDPQGWSIVLMNPTERIFVYRLIGVIVTILICTFIFIPLIVNYKTAQSAEALRESEQRLNNILQGSPIPAFVITKDHKVMYWNKALEEMSGIKTEEVMGTNQHWKAFYGEKRPCMADLLVDGEIDVIPQWYEGKYTKSKLVEGAYEATDFFPALGEGGRWLRFTAAIIRNSMGDLVGTLETLEDITERKQAEEGLKQTLEKLRKSLIGTIQAISSTIEIRDPYTSGHQMRVSSLARVISQEMGLSKDRVDNIRMAGAIHDIGKLSIPAEILSKPTKLTDIEIKLIRIHSQKGYDILKDVELPYPIAETVLQHHERFDGSGYPNALTDGQILLEARILAVADVVEAIASHRPYRPAFGIDIALEEIEKNRGILYDPEVVDVCLKLFREKGFQLDLKRDKG